MDRAVILMSARDLKEEVAWANEQIREEKAKLEKSGKNYLFHGADEELAAYLEDVRLGRRELEMLYTYPHYYRKFQCIASECEDTCCAGWEIMIDDKALEKYKKAKGPVGNRLKNSINWKEGSFLQLSSPLCLFK